MSDRVDPPQPPILVAALWRADDSTAFLQWQSALHNERGFIIIATLSPYSVFVPADPTVYSQHPGLPPWHPGTYSIVGWNEAGLSAPSNCMHTSAATTRRHATGH